MPASLLAVLALAACGEPPATFALDARVSAVEGRLDDLDAVDEDLAVQLSDLRAQVVALQGALSDEIAAREAAETRLIALEADHVGVADLAGLAAAEDVADLAARIAALETDHVGPAQVDALDARLAAVEGDYAADSAVLALGARVAALESDRATEAALLAAEARIAAIEGDYVTSTEALTLIAADTTVPVVNEVEIVAALAALDGARIARGATVTLALAAGTYTFTEPLDLGHPDGARLAVAGAGTSATVLSFPDSDGVAVEGGLTLGYLGDLTVQGGGGGYDGVAARDGGTLVLGTIAVQDFGGACLAASGGAVLRADQGLVAAGCGEAGVAADEGAFASAEFATVTTSGTAFSAAGGAALLATSAIAEACDVGFAANGAFLVAPYATASGCAVGFSAEDGGRVDAAESCVSGATGGSYATRFNAGIVATSASCDADATTSDNDTTDWVLGN